MESSIRLVPFPLLENIQAYNPSTIKYREDYDPDDTVTETEKIWIDIFRKSIPGYRKRAREDTSVTDSSIRADRFADRFAGILDDIEKDPRSHGGPPSCMSLCRLRELVLKEVGFEDIFKKVKSEENDSALKLLPKVLNSIDSIEDLPSKAEKLIRGVLAGNIFDLGATASADLFEKGGVSFESTSEKLLPRPWVIDHLDKFKVSFASKAWRKVIIFCDNSGADVILGIVPLARELLRRGSQVLLAANDMPAINDITHLELLEVFEKMRSEPELHDLASSVDSGRLVIVNTGSDLPVIDLSGISEDFAYLSGDADLVILEGMGRSIETNLNARFKCDSLNVGMVKHQEVAEFLRGRLYDCVVKFTEK